MTIYPNKCKVCKAPARVGEITLCSNHKCKSNRAYKKVLRAIVPPMHRTRDDNGFLICPECGKPALYLTNNRFKCYDQHYWDIECLNEGDKLHLDDRYYYEWSGANWRFSTRPRKHSK